MREVEQALNSMSRQEIEEIQSVVNGHLKALAVRDHLNSQNAKPEIRLDEATPEELLEEKAYLDCEWDPIFNIDKDRMISGAIEPEYTVTDTISPDNKKPTKTRPVLHYELHRCENPSEDIIREFFTQFLNCDRADSRFYGVTIDMLCAGYRNYTPENGRKWLWGFINDLDEIGGTLKDPHSGKEIFIDVCASVKEDIEDWERKEAGLPKLNRKKLFSEEDVFDRVHRKYRRGNQR